MITPALKEVLAALAKRWPVGSGVQHILSEVTGVIVRDETGDAPGATVDTAPAHSEVGTIHAVCVRWDHQPHHLAWMNTTWLRRLATTGTNHHHRERRRSR